jgi:hypothetical protein
VPAADGRDQLVVGQPKQLHDALAARFEMASEPGHQP